MHTIQMLHFADIHIGMENYGRIDPLTGTSSRVRDFLERMDEMIDIALKRDVDLVVFAGDAFKTRTPDQTKQREFARRIKRLADHAPILLLVGNHDLPGVAVKASTLDIFGALDVPNVIVGNQPAGQVVQTKRGPVYLAWMPYPIRTRLLELEKFQAKSLKELDEQMRKMIAERLEALTQTAQQYDMPRVLSGHFTVGGATLGSERTVMLGEDVAVELGVLAHPAWDYVAMGHIHKHQDVNHGRLPPVVYSGDLERIDFGEEKEEKGFCWVELQRGNTQWQFVPVQARPFLTIRADVREESLPTESVLRAILRKDVANKVVRVLVKLKASQVPQLRERELQQALAGAYHFTISQEVEHEARTRLGGLNAESLTPEQLVERYFLDKKVEDERVQQLVALAQTLFKD